MCLRCLVWTKSLKCPLEDEFHLSHKQKVKLKRKAAPTIIFYLYSPSSEQGALCPYLAHQELDHGSEVS